MKYYVIATSQSQGHHWINTKRVEDNLFDFAYPNRNDIVVVTRPDHLRGHNVEHGILLEGWRTIPDIEEILFLAMIHSQGRILPLKQAYDSLSPTPKRPTPKKATISGTTYNQAIIDAADALSKHIDQALLDEFTHKINQGINDAIPTRTEATT